jgi:hypothetical protein
VVCAASATSHQGGAYPGPAFRDTDLGGGEYMVTVSGASKVRAREIAFGRAAEVCGSGGFDLLDGDVDAQEHYVATTHGSEFARTTHVHDATTYDVTLLYQCRSGAGRIVDQHRQPRPSDDSAAALPRY